MKSKLFIVVLSILIFSCIFSSISFASNSQGIDPGKSNLLFPGDKYNVTVNAIGDGSGKVTSNVGGINFNFPSLNSGTTTYLEYLTTITVTGAANIGAVSWNDCVSAGGTSSGNGTKKATCNLKIQIPNWLSNNKTITATFTIQNYLFLPLLLKSYDYPFQLTCESSDYQYAQCGSLVPIDSVRVATQLSTADCIQGDSWGFTHNYIWVDKGCRAIFDVNYVYAFQIDCESADYQYAQCGSPVHIQSAWLGSQLSDAACIQGQTFGFTSNYVWVDQGCRGIFNIN